eukprot:2032514-Pyramimonas_sp.AAC.1
MYPSQSDHSVVTDASPVDSAGACRGQSCDQDCLTVGCGIHHNIRSQPQMGPAAEDSARHS